MSDSPEPTVVRWRGAGASFGPYTEWYEATIAPATKVEEATLITTDRGYRWVQWVSGPQATVFTRLNGVNGPHRVNGAGRTIGPDESQRQAYFERGWGDLCGLSGMHAEAYGIEECRGPFCR